MPRLELIFLHSANGGGCFRWRDEDSTYLQSEPDARPEYVGLKGNVVEVVILQAAERSPLQIQQSSIEAEALLKSLRKTLLPQQGMRSAGSCALLGPEMKRSRVLALLLTCW